MVRRVLVALLACAACATVADLEVSRSGNEGAGRDSDDSGVIEEGGAITVAEAGNEATIAEDSGPPVVACNCDAGSACCIRTSTAPACDAPSCAEPGSLVLGCVRSTNDGRDCCWKPDGGIAQSSFATSGCPQSTAACQSDADCGGHGGKCTTLTCKGVLVGVCAAAAPPWFVCPP